jgi:hypothetical protein
MAKQEEYMRQLNNMTQYDIYLVASFDDGKRGWKRERLVGAKDGRRGGQSISTTAMPWPRRVKLRWWLEGFEEWREQEIELPLYPLRPDGVLSTYPYLYLVFFENRVLTFGSNGGLDRKIEDMAKIEYEAARAAGVPEARMVSCASSKECASLGGAWAAALPQPNTKADVDKEKKLPPFPTCKDVDDCVRLAVLENSVFVEACGTVAPEIKKEMQNAFANWVVLKLPIPGLQQTLLPDNPDRASLLEHIQAYLKKSPINDVGNECLGRYYMMKNPEPTILSDAASLPKDVLKRYQR